MVGVAASGTEIPGMTVRQWSGKNKDRVLAFLPSLAHHGTHPIHLFLDKKTLRDSQNGQKTSVIKELPEEIQIVILSRYFEPLNKVKLHCRSERLDNRIILLFVLNCHTTQ